jgi:hypothetical protein
MTTETLIGDAPTNVTAPTQGTQTPTAPAVDASASTQQTPATDVTTTQDAPAGDKSGEAASAKPERAAPEKYEFKMPEGTTMDSEILAEFESTARELKMPQEEAQTMLAKLAPKIAERQAQQTAAQIEQASTAWTEASMADKEFGGDKLTENLALGEKALAAFGTPVLRQMLAESRFGNHPEVIRFMVRAGKALSEDNHLVTGGKPPSAKDAASTLYPNQH